MYGLKFGELCSPYYSRSSHTIPQLKRKYGYVTLKKMKRYTLYINFLDYACYLYNGYDRGYSGICKGRMQIR